MVSSCICIDFASQIKPLLFIFIYMQHFLGKNPETLKLHFDDKNIKPAILLKKTNGLTS